MSSADLMPVRVGVRFAHAAVQAVADSVGADVLHIKGPATDPTLLVPYAWLDHEGAVQWSARERPSIDADILVKPSHVPLLMQAMTRHGWSLKADFADGSAFEHAATMFHPVLGHVDVHRYFPGFGLDHRQVFEQLWQQRQRRAIAGIPCAVPAVPAQRLVLLLNAVRSGPHRREEIDHVWGSAPAPARDVVRRLATATGAEVALAAAIGELDRHLDAREHDLWALLAEGDPRPLALWRARVRAQPTRLSAAKEAIRLVVPNSRRLAVHLGRPLTRREIARAWIGRLRQGLAALGRAGRRDDGREVR